MSQFKVETNLGNYRDWLQKHPQEFRQQVIDATHTIVEDFRSDVAEEGPTGVVGTYQNARTEVITGSGHIIAEGSVWIERVGIEATEEGFKGRNFPIANILPWVIKVKGETGAQAKKSAFAVMKYLASRFNEGKHIFKNLTEKYRPIAADIYRQRLIARFGGK